MRNRIFRWLALSLLLLAALPLAVSTAQDGADSPIEVTGAWMRATVNGALPTADEAMDDMDMPADDEGESMDDMDMEGDDMDAATEEAADMEDGDAAMDDMEGEADAMSDMGDDAESMPGAPLPGMAGMNMGGVSALYMTLHNTSDSDERLLAVHVAEDVAGVVEIHETTVTDGVAAMQPLGDGLLVPAGETVTLEPGGYHVMMMGLQRDLVYGSTVPVTLEFESGLELALDVPVGEIAVSDAWVRAAEGMAMSGNGEVSAAYMVLENHGLFPDRLLAVESPAAAVIEIHETVVEDNVAAMHPLPDGLDLPPGEAVALEPGGYHVMLMDLQMALEAGSSVPLLLTFESGAQALVEAEVRAPDGM